MNPELSFSPQKKDQTQSYKTPRKIITSSDDFILYGKSVFESLIHSINPSIPLHWLCEEGKIVYQGQNILSFKIEHQLLLQPVFQSALQLLSHLSGLATLTHYYVSTINTLPNNNDKKTALFAKKREFSKWNEWEIKAVQQNGGQSVSLYTDDLAILTDNNLPNTTQTVVFICRKMETAKQLLRHDNKNNIALALHHSIDWSSIIDQVPFNKSIGLWGDISCDQIKTLYHPRLDFILPDCLSYPPSVDLFIKCL